MKILYRALSSDIAGGQKILLSILAEALSNGHEAIVSCPSPGKLTHALKEMSVPVHYISFKKTFHIHDALRFARFLKEQRVDLVHTHEMVAGNILARLGGKWSGVPVLSHIHIGNFFSKNPLIRSYQTLFDNVTSKLCKKIITISNNTKKLLLEQGIPSELIEVVFNGVQVPAPPPKIQKNDILASLRLPENAKLIGCVARLCEIKGEKVLLDAFQKIVSVHPDVHLLFIGEDIESKGKYEQYLKDYSKTLGLENKVFFLGHQDDVNSFLAALECLVLPSFDEGLPLVVLEAMAAKKPVVATSVGGTPELIIDGQTGFLVPPGNPQRLAEKINTVLSQPGLGESFGEKAYALAVEKFSKTAMLNRIMEIYQEIGGKVKSEYSRDNAL